MKKIDFKGPRDMHKSKCTNCGQETHVPFVPDPKRPVYCKECFQKHKPPKKD
ncbi:CxxC-x17-CxxC domain-containing protein [Methanococcoides methylutens]|uniref:CxxC-x17-CxxC domain-containing protein n=1 Tax=Methanococcoides methylutens TaxID=2226 RepID=UPI0009DF8D07|nr:CxxC-x17-CxxC domain-containing protein [Methanococcoides methylutens]